MTNTVAETTTASKTDADTAAPQDRRTAIMSSLKSALKWTAAASHHPVTTGILFALAGAFFLAWRHQIVPLATVWGDLGTWVAAVFTGGGLVFAGVSAKSAAASVRAQTKQQREQEQSRTKDEHDLRRAMAHSIAVSSWWAKDWTGSWCLCYRVVNKSPYPISQVTVRVWDLVNGEDDWTNEAFSLTANHPEYDGYLGRVIGTMLPDDEVVEAVRVNHPSAGPRPFGLVVDAADVRFVDVWANSWSRTDTKTVLVDGPDCMCQGCQDSVPESKVIPIWAPSPQRPLRLGRQARSLGGIFDRLRTH
ncbi:hypothetical protein ACIQH9_00340 [Pseudarthrobacter oxydans]|uniref:hypothetical protein n=1 Tax=Pseudarthrobacter oxydans TaxID=1671 RepID=UPI003800A92F